MDAWRNLVFTSSFKSLNTKEERVLVMFTTLQRRKRITHKEHEKCALKGLRYFESNILKLNFIC